MGPALLPPYPNGWYTLALSRDLPRGAVQPLTFMGKDAVLFRTRSGAVGAVDAYCPHLGAHLGYGGTVEGESIRCPFHGFCYDTGGACTFIPYGTKPPPLARLATLHAREVHGLVIAYHDAEGLAPAWEVPDLEMDGWSPLLVKAWRLRGHPQETSENSVDFGHFSQTHRYTDVEVLQEPVTDGPYLHAAYAMTRPAGRFGRGVRTEFEAHVRGLGYSFVEIRVPQYDLRARLFVLATPSAGREITLRVAVSLHGDTRPARIHPLLAAVPRWLVNRIIARATFNGVVHDVEQDVPIWQHKRYVQPPILAAGDGPVGKYRQWAKQFYRGADVALV
ncbi:MAG TPA: Rieske 2Fe-2S domain-containing protein [Dehalococcoidia bacterium]|nr:Rieske 2Fe-2S domain-containing protein [Dehalococcoidia bacterium]